VNLPDAQIYTPLTSKKNTISQGGCRFPTGGVAWCGLYQPLWEGGV